MIPQDDANGLTPYPMAREGWQTTEAPGHRESAGHGVGVSAPTATLGHYEYHGPPIGKPKYVRTRE